MTRSSSLLQVGRGHAVEPLKRRLLQSLTVVGVGDLDEVVGSLAKVFPEEVSDAVLRHQVVEMGPCSDHTSTCN